VAACSKPVVAAVHGFCYGLGVDVSSACDVRLCASDARFSVREVDIGLAADIGTLTRLPRCVGSASWVKEVCLSAREWGAEEAARVGFVSRAVAGGRAGVLAEAVAVAELIASKSPVAVWGTKEILDWSAERGTEDGLRYTAIWNAAMLQTEDVKKALLSGLRRTKPVFGKL
jgi:delta(3,5)-delta(2,4)-dienoyl-CoA isomerase